MEDRDTLPNTRLNVEKGQDPIWEWQPFGNSFLVIHLPHEVSWLARKTCEVLLRSKWEKVKELGAR